MSMTTRSLRNQSRRRILRPHVRAAAEIAVSTGGTVLTCADIERSAEDRAVCEGTAGLSRRRRALSDPSVGAFVTLPNRALIMPG
jgi:hypothetical protein